MNLFHLLLLRGEIYVINHWMWFIWYVYFDAWIYLTWIIWYTLYFCNQSFPEYLDFSFKSVSPICLVLWLYTTFLWATTPKIHWASTGILNQCFPDFFLSRAIYSRMKLSTCIHASLIVITGCCLKWTVLSLSLSHFETSSLIPLIALHFCSACWMWWCLNEVIMPLWTRFGNHQLFSHHVFLP